jgi:hypothetical protein
VEGEMNRRATPRTAAGPIDMGRARRRRATETGPGEAMPRSLARLVDSVAARWRGHEPEIAILATVTLMLAVAAHFAGADLLFTFMLAMGAAITIWSPWRQSE